MGFHLHGASLWEDRHVLCHQRDWERLQKPTVQTGKLRPGSPLRTCPFSALVSLSTLTAGIPKTWPLTAKCESRALKVQHLWVRIPATLSLNHISLHCRGQVLDRLAAARPCRPPATRGRCRQCAGTSRATRLSRAVLLPVITEVVLRSLRGRLPIPGPLWRGLSGGSLGPWCVGRASAACDPDPSPADLRRRPHGPI